MDFGVDEFGIPVLDGDGVEERAEQFLADVAPEVLGRPLFTPLAEIMRTLQVTASVNFELLVDLGVSPEGHKYLGLYLPSLRLISIDKKLTDVDPRFPFTVAHEIGHFYLHSQINLQAFQPDSKIKDSSRDIVIPRADTRTPRSRIEWQANRFAAAILIPRRTITTAVIQIQKAIGINRNLGIVWILRKVARLTTARS